MINALHLIWIIPVSASVGAFIMVIFAGSKVYPMCTLTLKTWMVERIVQILEVHPYTGAPEIIQSIKEQTKDCWKFKME